MSANIIIKKRMLNADAVADGYVDEGIVRRLFRKTATVDGTVNAGDTFTSSEYIAALKLPKGFFVEGACVDVLKANGSSSTLTVSAAKNASIASESSNNYDSADLVSLCSATLGTVGQYVGEALPTISVASTVGTPTSTKFIADGNDYIVLKASADVDAEFVLRVFGRWLAPELEA